MQYIVYSQLDAAQRNALLRRPSHQQQAAAAQAVAALEQEILEGGDAALQAITRRLDGVNLKPQQFPIERPLWCEAWRSLPAELQQAMQTALRNIAKFHRSELPQRSEPVVETTAGVYCWREFRAIETVGLYIPGGSAPLFSTMLMLGIPAIIAGCRQIIFCSPPVSPQCGSPYAPQRAVYAQREVLACMELLQQFNEEHANKTEVATLSIEAAASLQFFQLGGAQAIFAMAYGTAARCQLPQVAKIFGPGNIYVTEAKLRAARHVAMDLPAGPSEVLIIADNPSVGCEGSIPCEGSVLCEAVLAADLLAQAEHGPSSQVLLVSPSRELLCRVEAQVMQQATKLPRSSEIKATLAYSYLVETQNLAEAVAFSNAYAPEHLLLAVDNYRPLLPQIRNAGSVFCGPRAAESFGDYASGTNHTLPTAGFARSYSGINTQSFGRWLTFQSISEDGLRQLGPTVELLAAQEQLQGHKNAVTLRLNSI